MLAVSPDSDVLSQQAIDQITITNVTGAGFIYSFRAHWQSSASASTSLVWSAYYNPQ